MGTRPNAPAVIWLVGLTCLPEVVFTLAGSGLVGMGWLRSWAVVHFAFWAGLLRGWEAIYPFQRELMFVTYALLHGGFLHLVGNMIAVLALGGIVVARTGQRGFLVLYLLTAIGGGIGYGVLGTGEAPMVGASGAVFGLVGAWKYWEWRDRRAFGADMRPLWMSLVGLALLNVILWLALAGLLAWEAHLGGFLVGWAWAAFVTPPGRPRPGA
jgi:membrane associated rhomboid family serine protease